MKNKYELARWMHEEYEQIAKSEGWETQKVSRVDFDDLPESNRITMITLAERLISLLQSENPEVVSDAPPPSGVYTQVRERDESGQDSNSAKASVTVPLGNMIDDEKYCTCEIPNWTMENTNYCVKCDKVIDWGVQYFSSSIMFPNEKAMVRGFNSAS